MKFNKQIFTTFLLFAMDSVMAAGTTLATNPTIASGGLKSSINPALEDLIKLNLTQHKYKESLHLISAELMKDPNNIAVLYKQASIYADLGKYNKSLASLARILSLDPKNSQAYLLSDKIKKLRAETPYNEMGLDGLESYIDDLKAWWNYSSLHYYRLTDDGKYGGRVNYAHRIGSTAEQYQFEAYPQLTDYLSLSLIGGIAPTSQILFPTYQYSAETYFEIANGFSLSVGQGGQRYVKFSNQKIFSYVISANQYIGNYLFWFRPYHYTPVNTEFYTAGIRRYFNDQNVFINFRISAGKLPDIGDLPPLDQLMIVNQKIGVGIDSQFPLSKNTFLKLGLGYAKQHYPTGTLREMTDISLGMVGFF